MEHHEIHKHPIDDWTSLKALVMNLEAWNAERNARLQAQVKKHAKATALIALLQRELKALREKTNAVIEVPYDPETHDSNVETDPGKLIYELTDF